jgi:beta-aspartyl-peptidase (threonine type)
VILEELWDAGGEGGAIAVDRAGQVEMLFNTDGMVRGWTTETLLRRAMTWD